MLVPDASGRWNGATHRSVWLPNGLRLHVASWGPEDGPVVLLLHGWPQTAYAWRRVAPLLAENGLRAVAPDLRGFGDSAKPEIGFDKKTVAHDLMQLLDVLGAGCAWVVGHDMGGQVAFPFAAQWPQRTRGLVFMESGLPGFGQEAAMNVAEGGSWHFGFNRGGDLPEALVRGREHLFIEAMMRRENVGVFDPASIDASDIAVYAGKAAAPGALRCMFGYYRALLPTDRDDNLLLGRRPLQVPVLAVGAEHGYRGASLATMRHVAPSASGAIIAASGHYPAEERPAELAVVLVDFFKRAGGGFAAPAATGQDAP
jgi:pimeloyl-ACP methyl ester carboxylesterase